MALRTDIALLGLTVLCACTRQVSPRVEHRALPLSFERNEGQFGPDVAFSARLGRGRLFLTDRAAVIAAKDTAVRLWPKGGRTTPPRGEARLLGRAHYYRGADPARWVTSVETFARVRYAGVLPGVDLVFHGSGTRLEYDFELAPGAVADLRLNLEGTRALRIDGAGRLVAEVSGGELVQRPPLIVRDGERLAAAWRVLGPDELGFELPPHDARRPLIIDPVLDYSTFLGGMDTDEAQAVQVDAAGALYFAGQTLSADFPVASAMWPTRTGFADAFAAKLNPAGSALVYSTYFGGGASENVNGLAIDALGAAYMGGFTGSTDFPTLNAFQRDAGGAGDGFVLKLNPAGTLAYSTYLGGPAVDEVDAIDEQGGQAYVTGRTSSASFPVAGLLTGDGGTDVFVTALIATGNALTYSARLGSPGNDFAYAIAVDASGRAAVAGNTVDPRFPAVAALQPTYGGGITDGFAFVLNPQGTAYVWSTYLGGNQQETAYAIAFDATGAVYVGGVTSSPNFPVSASPAQGALVGAGDGFVVKVSPTGSRVWATLIGGGGGSGNDQINALAVDAVGAVVVAGTTTANAWDAGAPQSMFGGNGDGFVAGLNPAGSAVTFMTYLGGTLSDELYGLALGPNRTAWVVGRTQSTDFPLSSPLQGTKGLTYDVTVSRLGAVPVATPDGGGVDAGSASDAGSSPDAGSAGDAGSSVDAGLSADAGLSDGGSAADGGVPGSVEARTLSAGCGCQSLGPGALVIAASFARARPRPRRRSPLDTRTSR